ncbi:uncharacterized protein METZ01_LOCUS482013, partial [marine metagenome]
MGQENISMHQILQLPYTSPFQIFKP